MWSQKQPFTKSKSSQDTADPVVTVVVRMLLYGVDAEYRLMNVFSHSAYK